MLANHNKFCQFVNFTTLHLLAIKFGSSWRRPVIHNWWRVREPHQSDQCWQQNKPIQTKPNQTQPNPNPNPNQIKPNQTQTQTQTQPKSYQTKPNPIQPNPTKIKPNQTKPNPTQPNPINQNNLVSLTLDSSRLTRGIKLGGRLDNKS